MNLKNNIKNYSKHCKYINNLKLVNYLAVITNERDNICCVVINKVYIRIFWIFSKILNRPIL